MRKITKAVIPAAGFGTRFLPFTKAVPKEMLPIIDTPAIERIVQECIDSGITDILIIINEDKQSIVNHFDTNVNLDNFLRKHHKFNELQMINNLKYKVNIKYIVQKEQLGLGHAINLCKDFVGDDTFAILLPDMVYSTDIETPAIKQLIDMYENNTCDNIIGTFTVKPEEIYKYGICCFYSYTNSEGKAKIRKFVEKPKVGSIQSNEAIVGRYLLSSKIFKYLNSQGLGTGNEIQLTDAMERYLEDDMEAFWLCNIKGEIFDTGNKLGYLECVMDAAFKDEKIKNELLTYAKQRYNISFIKGE
jgi:UTP--glucose-1-phosphate uridylyltransferase